MRTVALLLLGSLPSSCTFVIQGHTPEPVPTRESRLFTVVAPTNTITPLMPLEATLTPWISAATHQPARTATSTPLTSLNCEEWGSLATPPVTREAAIEPERLLFDPGTTSLSATRREIAECEVDRYVIRLREGETLWVQLWPDVPYEARALFEVLVTGLGDGWIPSRPHAPVPATWLGSLPTTQDYQIQVTNRGPATLYSLSVDVPRWLDLEAAGGRISLPGAAGEAALNTYLFHADAGDHISVRITSPGDMVWFTLEEPDGQPVVRACPEGTHEFEGVARLTGDYVIIAGVFCCDDEEVEYTITVAVED